VSPSPLADLFLEAKNFTKTDRSAEVKQIVLHTAEIVEKPTSAEALAKWAAGPQAPRASWHFAVDNDTVAQSVLEKYIAWHAPGANQTGIVIELCGYARQTPAEWEDAFSAAVLERAAKLVAHLAAKWHIPVKFLDAAALRRGERGITTHAEVTKAFKQSTHTDPGAHFPMDRFLELVKSHA
jgi:N-acetyl-anhydromuramyl-L-alanine amidase AmpD